MDLGTQETIFPRVGMEAASPTDPPVTARGAANRTLAHLKPRTLSSLAREGILFFLFSFLLFITF